jgi:hypothetical protein
VNETAAGSPEALDRTLCLGRDSTISRFHHALYVKTREQADREAAAKSTDTSEKVTSKAPRKGGREKAA